MRNEMELTEVPEFSAEVLTIKHLHSLGAVRIVHMHILSLLFSEHSLAAPKCRSLSWATSPLHMWALCCSRGGCSKSLTPLDLFGKAEVQLKTHGCPSYFTQGYRTALAAKLQRGRIGSVKATSELSLPNIFNEVSLECISMGTKYDFHPAVIASLQVILGPCGLSTSLPVWTPGCLWLCKATKPTVYLHNNRHFFTPARLLRTIRQT